HCQPRFRPQHHHVKDAVIRANTPHPLSRTNSYARFTSRPGHDQCFRALADAVEIAERHPAIAAVTVIRRDGQALLRHESGGAGRASWALAAERLRPYTEQEVTA
ncbi:hypothetical protein ABZ532_31085, partial [Streptomyces sp. NPDC019396]